MISYMHDIVHSNARYHAFDAGHSFSARSDKYQ